MGPIRVLGRPFLKTNIRGPRRAPIAPATGAPEDLRETGHHTREGTHLAAHPLIVPEIPEAARAELRVAHCRCDGRVTQVVL